MARNRSTQTGWTRTWTRVARGTCLAILIIAATGGCATVRNFRANVHVHRGDAMLAAQRLDDAYAEFEEAARLAPQKPEPHARMGLIHKERGELEQAIRSFGEALRLDPTSFDDTFNLAQVYQMTQRIADAIRAYLYAIELRPDDFDATLNLGVCYQESGQLEQAVQQFEQAVKLDSQHPQGFVNLGVALDAQKRYYEAIRAYKEALELNEHQPLVLVNLARTYLHQDRLRMARGALEEAIELKPELAGAHEALGYCLFRLREFEAAEEAYQRALRYDWRLPQAYAGLGSISMLRFVDNKDAIEDRDKALEYWHRSLELNPDQPRLRQLIATYQPERESPADALLEATSASRADGTGESRRTGAQVAGISDTVNH